MNSERIASQYSPSVEGSLAKRRIKLGLLREAIERQGRCWFEVTTSSMEPALFPGDFVLVRAGRGRRFNIGEIVLFLSGAGYVVHRVTKKRRVGGQMVYWQKGDTVRLPEAIMESKIFGHVIAVKRGLETIDLEAPGPRVKNYLSVKYSSLKRAWHGDPAEVRPRGAFRVARKINSVLRGRAFTRKILRPIYKNSFEFRLAQPSHFFEIQRLFKLDRAVQVDPDCYVTVALRAGTAVGALVSQESDSSGVWWINGLRVDRSYRGLGVAANLIYQTEQALRRKNAAYLRMWAKETNFPAINLYHKLGYVQLPLDSKSADEGIVVFEKELNDGGAR